MPNYQHACTPSGVTFLTLATFNRRPILAERDNVKCLRQAATLEFESEKLRSW